MSLVLNEDEIMLRDTVEGFFAEKAPVKQLRELRDNRDDKGYSESLWSDMAEMGLTGVLVDEDHGGVAMGYRAAGLIAEQMGRNLTASPFMSSSVMSAATLASMGSDAQKGEWLPKLAGGEAVITLALDEGRKHNPAGIKTAASASGNGFKLSGAKAMVLDGHVADRLIVAARTSGEPGEADGLTLFLVDPKAKGVEIERTIMVDSHNAARITMDDVEVDGDDVIGEVGKAMDKLTRVLSGGRAIAAAELLGAGGAAFDITVDYIKERKQFGTEIGRFQALQHRASHMYSEYQLARSAVLAALSALDVGDAQADLYCHMAKAKLGDFAKLAGLEGIQMHGGVGMTDEYDIGLYLKRIRVLQELLGDAHYQSAQVAKTLNF